MSLFRAEDHAANPPSTWLVVKAAPKCWRLTTKTGGVLGTYPTKGAAEKDRVSGFYVNLYEDERRWYAGQNARGWGPR
jgi:hypothetical protein